MFRDLVATGPTVRLTESHRMNPADPAGAAVLDAARAIAAGDLGGTRHARGPHARPSSASPASSASSRTGRPRRPPAARCRRSSITGTRPGSAPAPTPPGRATRCAPDNDGELDPDAAAAAMAALDRQQRSRLLTVTRGGFAGADRINSRSRAARGRGRRAARPGGRRHPPGHARDDHAQRLRPRSCTTATRGWSCRSLRGNGGRPTPAAVFQRGGALVPFPLTALHGALARRLRVDGPQGAGQRARSRRADPARRRPAAAVARAGLHGGHARPALDHRRRPPRAARARGRRARSNDRPASPNGLPPLRPRDRLRPR